MSEGCAKVLLVERIVMDLMCVFCEAVWDSDTYVCFSCDEYKGLMPLNKAVEYLGLPIGDFPQLRHA
jgi:hypothetical protein